MAALLPTACAYCQTPQPYFCHTPEVKGRIFIRWQRCCWARTHSICDHRRCICVRRRLICSLERRRQQVVALEPRSSRAVDLERRQSRGAARSGKTASSSSVRQALMIRFEIPI